MSGINACGENEGDLCPNLKIINNIVIGVENAAGPDSTGFTVPAHECYDYTNVVFRNNTAHSIEGYGANIYINPTSMTQGTCMEGSYFVAYKCTEAGVGAYSAT